jgi:hypothetical protein
MSLRLQVLTAQKALIKAALPNCDFIGLSNDSDRPARISPLGTVAMRDGDLGEPEIDLSPPTYHYDHRIPVEVMAVASPNVDIRVQVDGMAFAIGEAIAADRTLGGLCVYVDVTALDIVDVVIPGGPSQLIGQFDIVASYHTTSPLG